MGKFKFYQDKAVIAFVRDYYTIEAETLEDAIAIIKEGAMDMDSLERKDGRVEFDERDMDITLDWVADGCFNEDPVTYSVHSCDLDGDEVLWGENK